MNNIAQIRKCNGLTRKDLSDEIGYTETAIYYWETGRRKLPADALQKIAGALNVPMAQLLETDETLSPEGDK